MKKNISITRVTSGNAVSTKIKPASNHNQSGTSTYVNSTLIILSGLKHKIPTKLHDRARTKSWNIHRRMTMVEYRLNKVNWKCY